MMLEEKFFWLRDLGRCYARFLTLIPGDATSNISSNEEV